MVAPFLLATPLTLIVPIAIAEGSTDFKSASDYDIFLYSGIGSSYVCNARAAGIEFPKAVGIAAATYVQVLNGRHGGQVASAGSKKLSNEQLFAGAEFQVITGALKYCPKDVPVDVKSRVEEAIKRTKQEPIE